MKKVTYIVLLMTIIACGKEINNIILIDNTVVVSAYLYAGQPIDSIRLTKSISYSNEGELETIDGIDIVVKNGVEDILLESIGDGYYRNLGHVVKEDNVYTLEFSFEGDLITSETYIQSSVAISLSRDEVELEKIEFTGGFPGGPGGPGGQNQEVVDISWDNPKLDYFFVDIENIEDDPDYVNDFFKELENFDDRPMRFFRTEPEVMDTYSINSQRELQIYGTYLITVYRLNAEYAALYETVGNSTISIQEPPSNITNGLGIFTGVTPHYLTIEVKEK